MEVQITSRKLIVPASPTPPLLQNFKISSFDHNVPAFYVTTFFYYPADGQEHVVSNVEKSLQMQKSLSEILTLYYPFAGRHARDDPLIECHDQGVEYLEAQVNGSLSQLLEDQELENNLHSQLAPMKFNPINSSPLSVQVNMFECGGLAIGISTAHKIFDGVTASTFFNAWATACRMGVDKVQRPSFELSSIFPARDGIKVKDFAISRPITEKIVTKRFVFDGIAISNLQAATHSSASSSSSEKLQQYQVTRVKVVTALIWKAFIRVAQARHGRLRPSLLKLPVGLRGKTKLPIPENSCGNLVGWAMAQINPDDESEVKLHDLVSCIHNEIENNVSNYAKVSSGDELVLMVMDEFRKVSDAVKENEADIYMFTCWCRLPIYEVDFGWGKPTSVRRGVQFEREMILLVDTRDGTGIEAWVSVEENNMLLFQQDPDIVAYTCNISPRPAPGQCPDR